MSETDTYTLYGSYASYFTAKPRSYLRKKGIPFVERVPGTPRFREFVRPQSRSHRIPQLETPDGTVVQDTNEIFDYLEACFPQPAARPPGTQQAWACRLMEALVDPTLVIPAWHLRWNYMDENYRFVGREFGRSFRPRGSDEEVDHYGRVIADRMEGHREHIGVNESHFAALEAIYDDALDILEAHVATHPYLFGGLPSIADHALMGPLFGHLARDPEPAMRMKQRAPRVFRWTEHMNTPEIIWPELFDAPAEYLLGDEIPETTRKLLKLFIGEASERFVETAKGFSRWMERHPDHRSGTPISEQADEPSFGRATVNLRGVPFSTALSGHQFWVLQRAYEWRDELSDVERDSCAALLREVGGEAFVDLPRPGKLCRRHNRLCLA